MGPPQMVIQESHEDSSTAATSDSSPEDGECHAVSCVETPAVGAARSYSAPGPMQKTEIASDVSNTPTCETRVDPADGDSGRRRDWASVGCRYAAMQGYGRGRSWRL